MNVYDIEHSPWGPHEESSSGRACFFRIRPPIVGSGTVETRGRRSGRQSPPSWEERSLIETQDDGNRPKWGSGKTTFCGRHPSFPVRSLPSLVIVTATHKIGTGGADVLATSIPKSRSTCRTVVPPLASLLRCVRLGVSRITGRGTIRTGRKDVIHGRSEMRQRTHAATGGPVAQRREGHCSSASSVDER